MAPLSQEAERIHRIMDVLALPPGQFMLSGSAVMVLHGIQRHKPMGDLDVFLAARPWMELACIQTKEVSVHGVWRVWTTDPADPLCAYDPPYLIRELFGLEVNVFPWWRRRGVGDIDVAFWAANAETVAGLPCVPLGLLLDWKVQLGRDKDLRDILAIREHLGVAA